MSERFGRLQKATALVPMAVLSAAVTAGLVGGQVPTPVAAPQSDTSLPDGTSIPAQAIEAPASVTGDTAGTGTGVGDLDAQQVVATASTSGIPSAALAAYQRAETVINAADPSCNLPWQLVAAIGRVESNHGRANGNTLSDDGVATPGIFGIALDGTNRTQEIVDTDAGQYDDDTTYDRAVGPMQFIPSTWAVVGVDADGDGVRNPQDIDDAALGTAVYLCSGDDDLGTDAGRQAAVYRYNHSQSYVDLVLEIMEAYMDGDFSSVPNSTVTAGEPVLPVPGYDPSPIKQPQQFQGNQQSQQPSNEPSSQPTEQPTQQPPTQQTPTQQPTQQTTQNQNNQQNQNNNNQNNNNSNQNQPSLPTSAPTLPTLPSTQVAPVDDVLTAAQAITQCTLDGVPILNTQAWQACLDNYTK